MLKRVVLGMSGGIDSTMSALLLKNACYQVIGATFMMFPLKQSLKEEIDNLVKSLAIEHYYVDLTERFNDEIIGPCMDDYQKGLTPSPCIRCNMAIKFPSLLEKANELSCGYIATGHYVKTEQYQGLWYVAKGTDPVKDQSYFLWKLNQDVLKRALFPLGRYKKQQIKELARQYGYGGLAGKKESAGLCFLQGGHYYDFLDNNANKPAPGIIRDLSGNCLGSHQGLAYYTIGQKKRLGINPPGEYSVHTIDLEKNELIVSSVDKLYSSRFVLTDHYFHQYGDALAEGLVVKIRGIGENHLSTCKVSTFEGTGLLVETTQPLWAVAPGQPVAFYQGARLVGGGYVKSAM